MVRAEVRKQSNHEPSECYKRIQDACVHSLFVSQ